MISKAIPNAFTLGNLFMGVLAITFAMEGSWQYAGLMVVVGMLLDGLDGRLARALGVESEFGKELDSLSDIVTFGLAPAIIMYAIILKDYGLIGMIITGIFPICGAMRLARFNVTAGTPGYFTGLPITAAGGVLATFSFYFGSVPSIVLVIAMLVLAYLMISTVRYPSFKTLGWPKSVYYIIAAVLIITLVVAFFYPNQISKLLFLPLAIYALYGFSKRGRVPKRFFRKKRKI